MPPENTSKYVTARIDYFPMQRWVHVVGTVKDDSLSIYMNNSMYTVANVSDIMNATDSNPLRPIFAATTGSISVGNSGVESMNELKGFVAQFKFFNYALTTKDINSIYKVGPSSSTFLSRLGISGYGLRSPLYKVSAT
jgi:hypothetical protein